MSLSLHDDARRKDHLSAFSRDVLRETQRLFLIVLVWTAAFVVFVAIAVFGALLAR
jgi:hypothetical protein